MHVRRTLFELTHRMCICARQRGQATFAEQSVPHRTQLPRERQCARVSEDIKLISYLIRNYDALTDDDHRERQYHMRRACSRV